MRLSVSSRWFLAFAAVFAACAGLAFWGTWSADVVPVMPDDPYNRPSVYADVLTRYVDRVLSTGKIIPTDLVWEGLVCPAYCFQELKYVLSVFCAALGLVYFLRGRGLSRPASYGAGLLLAFSGYWFTLFSAGHGGWFVWMSYGVFAFGLADRAVRLGLLRHSLLLGLVVSWAGFQQQDLWLLFSVFTAVYYVWCCVRERTFPWKGALVSLAAFVLVGLPNFKDTIQNTLRGRIEQISQKQNITDTAKSDADQRWEFVTNWSLPTEDTLEFVDSRVHGDTSCPFVLSINGPKGVRPYTGALGRPMNAKTGNYRQHSLYVGWVTCLLALVGAMCALKKERRSEILFFVVSAAIFYAFSLGRYCEPAYRVIFSLPFGDLIRCPVKWHHLTELCLAVLAAYGIDGLRQAIGERGLARFGGLGTVVVCALVLFGAFDLVSEANRFCAPVSMKEARRTNSTMQLTILSRKQFQNPQVAAMARAGRIVSVANYMGNPDYFVVGILEPYKLDKHPADTTAILLGLVSLLSVFTVVMLAVRSRGSLESARQALVPPR